MSCVVPAIETATRPSRRSTVDSMIRAPAGTGTTAGIVGVAVRIVRVRGVDE
jgi:hypothetical protein